MSDYSDIEIEFEAPSNTGQENVPIPSAIMEKLN